MATKEQKPVSSASRADNGKMRFDTDPKNALKRCFGKKSTMKQWDKEAKVAANILQFSTKKAKSSDAKIVHDSNATKAMAKEMQLKPVHAGGVRAEGNE